jgi:hypothetical protein
MNHQVGNIPVYENFTTLSPGNFIGRHTAIAAAYP